MQRDSLDLGKVDIPRLFRIYFVPTLMGMLSLCAVTATDGIFVGRGAGSDALAAVNICIAPTMVIMGIGLMLGVGASVVASLHLADGNIKAARLNSTQALITATLVALAFFALTLTRPEATSRILGCSDTLMPLALSYMPWIFTTCLFQLWCAIGLFVVRLDGSPRYAMWCNVLPGLLNVVLDYVYIFPLGMGIEGAGIATFLSCMAGALMVIGYLVFGASTLRLIKIKASLKSLRLSLRNIGVQCKIGISALLGEATMGMMMLMGNLVFMHYIGDKGVSAFSIVCYYCPFVFMIGNAIAQSAQPIISYNYGLGDHRRVADTERLALLSALGCGTIVTLAFIIFPHGMVRLFLSRQRCRCHSCQRLSNILRGTDILHIQSHRHRIFPKCEECESIDNIRPPAWRSVHDTVIHRHAATPRSERHMARSRSLGISHIAMHRRILFPSQRNELKACTLHSHPKKLFRLCL